MFADAEIHTALVRIKCIPPTEFCQYSSGICGRVHNLLAPETSDCLRDVDDKRNWINDAFKPVFRAWLIQRGVDNPTEKQVDWPVEHPDDYFRAGNKWEPAHPAYWRRMDLLDFMINYFAP